MCGIVGFWNENGDVAPEDLRRRVGDMAACLQHRGPDANGEWADPEAGVALGHKRLSIIDLSEEGHQPMVSHNGRYVMVYNGEIYNFKAIRKRLEDNHRIVWRGHSDTEVLLEAFSRWGGDEVLSKVVGMFAFAVWDRAERRLFLARDRMGEKPLYYGRSNGRFFFGSELKSFRQHPAWEAEVDAMSVDLYFRYKFVPAPRTIYENVKKLQPGELAQVADGGRMIKTKTYWSAGACADRGRADPFEGSDQEAVARLDQELRRAVKSQMHADVPLGAFLSGGIDSSTIVALMQQESIQPVRTFTIGFENGRYDEAQKARAVAEHLRTDHTELQVEPQDARDVIAELPRIYDEPFADISQIPTYLVARLTRQHVTVSLSGDGADELFGGYARHLWGARVWQHAFRGPAFVRRGVGKILASLPASYWRRAYEQVAPLLPQACHQRNVETKIGKLANVLQARTPDAFYRKLLGEGRLTNERAGELEDRFNGAKHGSDWTEWRGRFAEWLMMRDLTTYLPGDILTKVDRSSMAVSLESRAPFLDHRVAEFASRLPLRCKLRNGEGKWALRQVLYQHVPKMLVDRPKAGFAAPVGNWIRGPLREWAEELLSKKALRESEYLSVDQIRKMWQAHRSGKRNWEQELWNVLMFQTWRDRAEKS